MRLLSLHLEEVLLASLRLSLVVLLLLLLAFLLDFRQGRHSLLVFDLLGVSQRAFDLVLAQQGELVALLGASVPLLRPSLLFIFLHLCSIG